MNIESVPNRPPVCAQQPTFESIGPMLKQCPECPFLQPTKQRAEIAYKVLLPPQDLQFLDEMNRLTPNLRMLLDFDQQVKFEHLQKVKAQLDNELANSKYWSNLIEAAIMATKNSARVTYETAATQHNPQAMILAQQAFAEYQKLISALTTAQPHH